MAAWQKYDKKLLTLLSLALILIIVTRLPQLTGGMLPDGDEAIVGLMARHLAAGKELPLFFYGQSYGFSFLEAGIAALLFKLFGSGTVVLKVGMLLLWTLGCLFLMLSVREYASPTAALIAALLLISCPAWFLWSMKARGGYLSAFFLCHLTIWLTACLTRCRQSRPAVAALIGGNIVLVYLCQPLWLAGLLPFICLPINRWTRRDYVWIALSALVATIGAYRLVAGSHGYYTPELFAHIDPAQALAALPYRLWGYFSGSYFFATPVDIGDAVRWLGGLWTLLFLITVLVALGAIVRRRCHRFSCYCLIAMLFPLIFSLISNGQLFGFRYFLPVAGFSVMLLSEQLARIWPDYRRTVLVGVSLLVMAGLATSASYSNFPYDGKDNRLAITQEQAVGELIAQLLQRGVRHVYCLDPMLQWNIIFASEELILARWFHPTDRYPAYPAAVDQALYRGQPVAIVGKIKQLSAVQKRLARFHPVAYRKQGYFILPVHHPSMPQQLGFYLNPPTK